MFKHLKNLFLAFALILVSVLVLACQPELNKETCKEFCDTCEKCPDEKECPEPIKCPEINAEACKDYVNNESCKPFVTKEACKEIMKEADKENCKEFCPEPEYNAETCKEFGPNADNCKEYFPIIAPTGFTMIEDIVTVDNPTAIIAEDFEPYGEENVYTGLYWSSSDEEIATVDKDGIVTGHRPGTVDITATSVLDETVTETVTVTVKDNRHEGDAYAILKEEKDDLLRQIPTYAAESFDFPQTWNKLIEMEITDGLQNKVSGFVKPAELDKDTVVSYNITLKLDDTTESFDLKIWAVKDAKDNVVNRLNLAVEAAEILIKEYTDGALVDKDLVLPTLVYGTELVWDSQLPNKISDEGKYTRQLDDTPVKLDLVAKCGDNATSKTYSLKVKGYTEDEKVDYILNEGSLALVNGKEVSTSIVLPAFDSKFKAALSYVSSKPEVMDNEGKLVAPVTEKTEVEFTVTVDYSFSKVQQFKKEAKFTVTVVPQNKAAQAAEAWLQESGFNKVVDFAYGTEKGNVLNVPVKYTKDEVEYTVKWDVTPAKVAPKYLADEKEEADRVISAFELTSEGKPELVVQYLRYTQVPVIATFEKDGETATVALVLSIGASSDATAVYTATWESGDQKDTSLNERTGMWDCIPNGSHFDQAVGYVARTLGYGYWSGLKVAAQLNGANYEYYNMDYMYWEVADDKDGNPVKVARSLFNNAGDMGGNWGWFMKNTTNHDILIEVGTYAASGQTYKGGVDSITTAGSRLSWSMDGYALGFVADKDGKVLHAAGTNKLQTALPKENIVEVGSDAAKNLVGDTTTKGSKVHYFVVPAGGYAMSWKYQFYGLGDINAVNPFCQEGSKLEITQFGVHPLNSQKATTAKTKLENAEKSIALGGVDNNKTIEANLIEARNIYNNDITGITKEKVFEAARLEAAEAKYAEMLNAELALILSKEGQTLPEGEKPFVTQMGEMYTRLQKLTEEILAKFTAEGSTLTAKAAFDAKYAELAAIELKVTLDYQGGYAKGLYAAEDFNIVIPQLLSDIYDWFVEQGAFNKKVDDDGNLVDDPEAVVPSREQFNNAYFGNNYAKYDNTVLTYYLFTPKTESDGTVNENYHDVIPGTTKFFNSEKYHDKWIDMMDYVDEATRAGNMGGQDAWARNGEISSPAKWSTVNLVQYNGKDVTITNKGALLGAYRFAQYIAGSIGKTVYKDTIPADHYAAIFDRQMTQEKYSTVIYHCTDSKVELPKAAHKDGAIFAGWFFEDGTAAEITGAFFKDVTVYAKWLPMLEEKVEETVGKDVEGVYYGAPLDANKWYSKTTPTGTINEQTEAVGLGKYAIVVGNKLFVTPKFSLIELGKDATADVTYDSKDTLQVYGTDGSAQFSTGLIYDPLTNTVKAQNSYGHGALYQNVSDFNVTISNVDFTYGRNLGGTAYGYNRYHFALDTEKNVYVGKLAPVGSQVVLAKGDFLWCPMTADRFCSGLTDCDGTSGVVGVLSDGIEVNIIDVSGFLPVEVEWHTVKFMNDDAEVSVQYLDKGQKVAKPADLVKAGYDFMGWNTDKEATEGIEVVEELTEDVTYYAIWKKADKFDAVTVNQNTDGNTEQEYATIAEALNHVKENAVITIKEGTYDFESVVSTSVTFKGQGADKTIINVKKDVAANLNAETIIFDGVKLVGTGAGVGGTYFQVTGQNKLFKVVNSTVEKMNSFYKGRSEAATADCVFKNVKFYEIGQFITWIQESNITLTVEGCEIANCGQIDSVYAALFRIRKGSAEIKGNVFTNDPVKVPALFESGANATEVKVENNIFCNITKFVKLNDVPKPLVFGANLYLDAEGNALKEVPATVTGAEVVAGTAKTQTNAGSMQLTNFATDYVNGTAVYLAAGYKFNDFYAKKLAIKYVGNGLYVAVGDLTNDMVWGVDYDNTIAIHGDCTHAQKDAYTTLLKSIEAGSIVKFEGKTYEEISALTKGAIDINVTFYKVA